jgi:hypothetical protein
MKNLQPTLSVQVPAIDPSGVLQLLESGRASGTVRAGGLWLRLRAGIVVKASAEPVEVILGLLAASGEMTFRAVSGDPSGPLSAPVTSLLLEACRLRDEAGRAA